MVPWHACIGTRAVVGALGLLCVGAANCSQQCPVNEYAKRINEDGELDNRTCIAWPLRGVIHGREGIAYEGGVWHDPDILNPDPSTRMYACVKNGCPSAGTSWMKCQPGYKGVLCAICVSEK